MAGAKQHNPGVRRTGRRKVGTAGTECEKNSGQSLIIPGSAIRSTDDVQEYGSPSGKNPSGKLSTAAFSSQLQFAIRD
jgi:hypothetical protein